MRTLVFSFLVIGVATSFAGSIHAQDSTACRGVPRSKWVYDTVISTEDVGPSLKPDHITTNMESVSDTLPIFQYEELRWDDAYFSTKVWRELNLKEKMNQVFKYQARDDQGSRVFADIITRSVISGTDTAYADDRFTTKLTPADVSSRLGSYLVYTPDTDPNDKLVVVGCNVTKMPGSTELITNIRLKEEWVFDRESSRMFVRILGLGLCQESIGNQPGACLAWLYYPDLRKTLSRIKVYNSRNMGNGSISWDKLFNSRMFSSTIIKTTLENTNNQFLSQYKGLEKSKILQLIEGEHVKDKIFNFEQGLWSY